MAETWNALAANSCRGFDSTTPFDIGQQAETHRRALPRFLVAGPPRTGTSWLHEVLQPHARLPLLTKETRFFDLHYERGLDWYLDHFPSAGDGRPAGEVAPTYFASACARKRIARTLPQVRLIFIFRHPLQRLVSLYRLKRAYGMVGSDLETALHTDPELLASSRYAEHLLEWQRLFPPEQIHVALYDNLTRDPQSFAERIAEFAGLPAFRLEESLANGQLHSSSGMTEPRCYLATRAATAMADWCKGRKLDRFVLGVRQSKLNRFLLGGGAPFPEIPRETLQKTAQLLLPETEKLEALLGCDLSAWKRWPDRDDGGARRRPQRMP